MSSTSASDYLSSEKYGCFQRFFPGVNLTNSNASGSSSSTLANPFSSGGGSDSSPVLGCALMRMVPKETNKFFLKSEITFKNDTQGWAIWTHLTNYNASNASKVFLYFRILFLGRNNANESWSIKGGVYLKHFGSSIAGSPKVSTPDGEWNNHPQEKHYSGFWESSNDSQGKGLMEEIKMEYDGDNKLFNAGNIHTTNNSGNGLTCKGIYDTSSNKWNTWSNGSNCCISGALTQAFASFKDKKGKWTPVETYCNEAGSQRYSRVDDTIKERVKGLCYPQNSTT